MNKPANYWNFNTINAVAQQCKSIAEFRERFMSAYTTAHRLKITKEIFSHMKPRKLPIKKEPIEKRFFKKKKKTKECWDWIACKDSDGYGAFWKNEKKRAVPAHRMSLELADINIPKGLVVDHICKNRGCVNPKHLRLVTPRVNALENTNSICVKFRKKE